MESPVFLEDIYPQNLLYAVTIRSPVANGYLKLITYPRLPAGYTLITAKNIPGENRLEDTDMPILAEGKISYIGEPVAILLGLEKTKLEELSGQFNVVVSEEQPVFSCADSQNAPTAAREIQIGNPQDFFEKPEKKLKIVSGSYTTGIQDHWYAEPSGAVTWYNGTNNSEETIVVKTATQWPYHVKRSIERTLGLSTHAPADTSTNISVEPTSLSLHMDGKLWYPSLISCHAALGTFILKKPVRLIMTRKEDFLYSPKRCKTNIDITSAIDSDGDIKASEINISVNVGAYNFFSEEILDQVCLGVLGFYNCPNFKITAKANRTNIPPQGPFSGFGLAHGFFAIERHVSQIADTVEQDPAQWRKRHCDTSMILSSASKERISAEDIIASAAKMSDYHRKWASYELLRKGCKNTFFSAEKGECPRGIGIALGYQGNGLLYHGEDNGNYSVEVTLTKDSFLEIKTSITSPEEYSSIWAKVAYETMSIKPEQIRLITTKAPDCGPSCASRNITVLTKLAEECCLAIRQQRFHDPLPITVQQSVKPQNGSLWNGCFTPPDINGFINPGTAAAVVEVSIDVIEFMPKIRGIWLCIDGGKIISVHRAKRSINRSAAQALGWTFLENIEYINGVLPETQFDNYTIPSSIDIPPIQINFLSGGEEPKGIGELPFICIPAAFQQAVSQAMDHCFGSIPLKRNEIWKTLRAGNNDPKIQVQR